MRSELFEETLKQHKDGLTDELEQLGKHRQAQLVAWDIEQNESDYEFYFNSAWNVQQSKIDELQKRIDAALVCVDQAKDGFYGFSCDGGDTDNLAKHLEKALRGASD